MTQITADKQIEAIDKVAKEALKSKETALKFLRDAGIIQEKPSSSPLPPKDKKK